MDRWLIASASAENDGVTISIFEGSGSDCRRLLLERARAIADEEVAETGEKFDEIIDHCPTDTGDIEGSPDMLETSVGFVHGRETECLKAVKVTGEDPKTWIKAFFDNCNYGIDVFLRDPCTVSEMRKELAMNVRDMRENDESFDYGTTAAARICRDGKSLQAYAVFGDWHCDITAIRLKDLA